MERLSALAAAPGPVSRETAQAARELWTGLAETCRGRVELRDTYKRGAEMWARIRDGYAAEKAKQQDQGEAHEPTQAEPDMQAEADGPQAADLDQNEQQKRRMIVALQQAAAADDPHRFVEHVRLCERAWAEIGPAGPDDAALAQAYRDAVAGFWQVVDARAEGGGR